MPLLNWFRPNSDSWHVVVNFSVKHIMHSADVHGVGGPDVGMHKMGMCKVAVHSAAVCTAWLCTAWRCLAWSCIKHEVSSEIGFILMPSDEKKQIVSYKILKNNRWPLFENFKITLPTFPWRKTYRLKTLESPISSGDTPLIRKIII